MQDVGPCGGHPRPGSGGADGAQGEAFIGGSCQPGGSIVILPCPPSQIG